MCGIVGFTGMKQAAPILLDGLSKLEYRGYDSAGIAVRDGDKSVDIVKAKGRLKILVEKTNDGKAVEGSCGIGREFDSCIIKIVRAGRIKPVLFLSSFSLYYLVIFSDM